MLADERLDERVAEPRLFERRRLDRAIDVIGQKRAQQARIDRDVFGGDGHVTRLLCSICVFPPPGLSRWIVVFRSAKVRLRSLRSRPTALRMSFGRSVLSRSERRQTQAACFLI